MSRFQRSMLVFAGILLILACNAPATTTPPTLTPPHQEITPTSTAASPAITDTPPEPQESTPVPPARPPIPHLSAGQSIKITFIRMMDAVKGWAIGGLSGNSDHVFRTADGGLTWKDVTPPEPAPADPQSPKQAIGFFMDEEKAWVVFSGASGLALDQAYIWRTTDSGTTWQYSALTEPALYQESYMPSDLSFVDAQHGWMIAHIGAGMNHDYYALLATSDGGATWTTLLSPYDDFSGTQSCYKSGMVFVTAQDGWMSVNCHGVVAIPYFFKTSDGGFTWQRMDLPAPPSEPDLFDNPNGYCALEEPPVLLTTTFGALILDCTQFASGNSSKTSFLYETSDAGNSWDVYAYPGGPVQFINALTAFALGRNIQRTDDGGHTWIAVKTVNWDGQFSFIDANTAWAVATADGQIALVNTTNGGATWQEIKPQVAP